MKTLNYFPHDFNARNDAKLVELRMNMGNRGIGIYWSIVEMLYEEGGRMELSKLKAVAFAINEELTNVQQVVQQYDLFEYDEQFFWSNAVFSRLKYIKKISDARAKAGKASGKARREKALQTIDSKGDTKRTNVQQELNKCSTNAEQKDEQKRTIKIKIKEKENKSNNIDTNVSSSSTEDTELKDCLAWKDEKVNIPKLVNFWNLTVQGTIIPAIRNIEGPRRNQLNARLKQYGKSAIFEAIKKVSESDFLKGNISDKGWHATFDWLVGPKNFAKVLEGNYDNQRQGGLYGNRYKGNYSSVQQGASERQKGYAQVVNELIDEAERERANRGSEESE